MHDRVLNSRGNSGFWNVNSNELYDAAKILWNCWTMNNPMTAKNPLRKKIGEKIHRFHWITMMLLSLSLETLLKGKIIKNEPLLITDKKFPLETHNLVFLFKKADIIFNDDEELFLKRLTNSVEWIGKYPIPNKSESFNSNNTTRREEDFNLFEELRQRIQKSH